ncbi:tetratricopeptide repeat protein [Streptomyces sp. NPDC098789]|uniref:tetratricopeptide repeat protein n=1 Tax=Streptomyces sp. NPDC098789 TaxID=3366098 RepID=UPI0037F64265
MSTADEEQPAADGRGEALSRLQARFADALASTGQSVTWLAGQAKLGRTVVSGALNMPTVPSARTVAAMARVLRLDEKELLELRRQAKGAGEGEERGSGGPVPVVGASSGRASAGDAGQVVRQPGLLVGAPPLAASAFQPREELRERIDAARAGGSVVLTQARRASAGVLSGMGGVGKSQLAAQYAHQAVAEGTGLVVWVPAGGSAQVITLYAQAAVRVGALGASGEDPEQDARAFLEWLATTERSWLVVLDDVSDPGVVGPWWPPARPGTGWTMATTRLHDPRLTGGGRTRIEIDVYTPREAVDYLQDRVTGDGGGHLLDGREVEVARVLGHLPLALGHAAAYLLAEELTCADYLARLADKALRLDDVLPEWADTEGYQRQVTAALLLSLDAAEQAGPKGVITPLVRLLSLLDPDGHPEALWTTASVAAFLTTARDEGAEPVVTTGEVVHALRVLRRYALITTDPHTPHRQIRMHALTARAIRETTPASRQPGLAATVADALGSIWPPTDLPRELAQALRANTTMLRQYAEEQLWRDGVHPVIVLNGLSLRAGGLHHDAHSYWASITERAVRALGSDHPDTITARANLAAAYRNLGRHHDALTVQEAVHSDLERLLGHEDPDTLRARANLAVTYHQLGRHHDALALQEAVLTDCERLLEPDHTDTIHARANLADTYRNLGRHHDALILEEAVHSDFERLSGHEHTDTLHARANLAATYGRLGRHHDALTLQQAVHAVRERLLGPDHPTTLHARANLAVTHGRLGHHHDALTLQQAVLTDSERVLGPDHPHTITARANLAVTHSELGRHHDALTLLEAVHAGSERILGPDHPDTLHARANLAATYHQLGRHHVALNLLEAVHAGSERILGPDHPDTLHARANLAVTYHQLGRHHDALSLMEAVHTDYKRILGPDHPSTVSARGNLAAAYHQLGRHHDAARLGNEPAP